MLHHDVTGPQGAPVVVLAGSLGSDMSMWEPQLGPLSRSMRVIRYDHRGHGRSPVPAGPYTIEDLGRDVLDLLDLLGVQRVDFCGLSLGGMVGMWLAARAPERINRLVLLSTAAYLPGDWLTRAELVRSGSIAAIAPTVLSRWFTADIPESCRRMLSRTPPQGYAACCEAIAAMDLRPLLPRISAPTLVIAGAQDPATPVQHAAEIAEAIPGSRLAVVANAAHLSNVEQPDRVTRLILKHLIPKGMTVRRAVLGDEYVDRAIAATDEFTADFQDLITRYAWGEVWARDGLDRRTRSRLTIALLAALRYEDELALHVKAALSLGVTRDEIKEVLLHVAIYAGVPAANRAFAIAARTLAENGGGDQR